MKVTYFSNKIIVTLSNVDYGIVVIWCNIMFTQLGVELMRWTKHQKSIATRNSQPTKKTMIFYAGPFVFDI